MRYTSDALYLRRSFRRYFVKLSLNCRSAIVPLSFCWVSRLKHTPFPLRSSPNPSNRWKWRFPLESSRAPPDNNSQSLPCSPLSTGYLLPLLLQNRQSPLVYKRVEILCGYVSRVTCDVWDATSFILLSVIATAVIATVVIPLLLWELCSYHIKCFTSDRNRNDLVIMPSLYTRSHANLTCRCSPRSVGPNVSLLSPNSRESS